MTIFLSIACGYFAGVLTVVILLIIFGNGIVKKSLLAVNAAQQVEIARVKEQIAAEKQRQVQRGPRL
jgi:hypothetical protein